MAEVFGVVVSALTVAEMAGKFGASIVKLKKLWDEVQDVPNEIAHLVRQLEILRPVLAEMEAEFSQRTHRVHRDSAANLSMEYCQQAVGELDALAEELQSRINTAKRSRRHITKLKVTFKKEQIQAYQNKIRFALQLLALSQQTYTISLVKLRSVIQDGPAQSTAANQPIQSEIIVGSPQARQNVCSGQNSWCSMASIPWRKASFFGAFVYQTTSDPSHPGIQVHQARVQIPWWISETVWDFQAQRACTGWKVLLKPWIMRHVDAPIFCYVRGGSWSDILEALSAGEASLQDVDPSGFTLLHVAVIYHFPDITKNLVDMGLSLTDVGLCTVTPMTFFFPVFARVEDSLETFRYALENGVYDDDVERYFDPEDEVVLHRTLPEIVWSIPGALEAMLMKGPIGLESYYQFPPEKRLSRLDWDHVNPRLLLEDLRKGGNLDPAAFRVILGISSSSSLASLAVAYFTNFFLHNSRWTEENPMIWDSWREIARWSFRALSVKDLCRKGDSRVDGLADTTPTIVGMFRSQFVASYNWYIPDPKPRWLSEALLSWLEDAQSSGIDLVVYGRRELELYLADDTLRCRRWRNTLGDASGWRLVSFTYGPEPQDWKLIWDLDAWEYAGDFWEQIENPPLHIPGAWVEG